MNHAKDEKKKKQTRFGIVWHCFCNIQVEDLIIKVYGAQMCITIDVKALVL